MKRIFQFLFTVLCSLIQILTYSQTNELQKIELLISSNDYAQSFAEINKLATQNPNNSEIYRLYAQLLLKMQNFPEALTNINKAILLSKENSTNYVIAGNIYRDTYKYTEAAKSYEYAMKLNPDNADIYYEYALLNLQHQYLIEAQRLLDLASNFNPNDWKMPLLKSQIALQKKQVDVAKKILLDAINTFPQEEELLYELAMIYIHDNQPQQAIILLQTINARFPGSPRKDLLIGDILLQNKIYPEALKYYLLAEKSLPNYLAKDRAKLEWKLFNAYYLNADIPAALTNIQQAITFSPNNQLYLAAYYYLLTHNENPTNQVRKAAANKFLELAFFYRSSGISWYYVSLLQKAGILDPLNIVAKDQLLEFAKIKNNTSEINNILQEIAQIETTNTKIDTIIQLRSHLQSSRRLPNTDQNNYKYEHLIFIQKTPDLYSRIMGSEISNIEKLFPNINSTVKIDESFMENSQYIFQNNTQYNMISVIEFDQLSNAQITTYDKIGKPITNSKFHITAETFSENIIYYSEYMSKLVPPIGLITKRLPNSTFEISLGSDQGISNNMVLAIFDRNFKQVSQLTVTNTATKKSIATLSGVIPSIDLINTYVVSEAFVSSTNNQPSLDINRISIPRKNL